jgi:serine phosphatase RsbU (regulator of sigma subunit)
MPKAIVNRSRRPLSSTGKKEESRDGIDIALCVIDSEKRIMQYSGANNPLYLIRNNNQQGMDLVLLLYC